jgi:hypothetical protein
MMGVDDVVAELELDVLDGPGLQVLQQLLFNVLGNGVLLELAPAQAGYCDRSGCVRSAGSDRPG